MPSPPSYGCCTRVNFVLKKHLLFQMNLSNSGLKNRSIKEYWLIFTVLKFPLGLQFSHNLTKFKIIKYISTIYIMTTTCTYLQQLTQMSDVAHGPRVYFLLWWSKTILAKLVEGLPRNILVKMAHWPKRRCCLKGFSFFSSDGHFVQRSGTILAILVEVHPRNISVKLF